MRIRDVIDLVEYGNLLNPQSCLSVGDFQPVTTGQLQPNVPASGETLLAQFTPSDFPIIVTRVDIQVFYTDSGPTQTWPFQGLDQRGYGSMWFEVNDAPITPQTLSWFLLAGTDLFLVFQKGNTVNLYVDRQNSFVANSPGVPDTVNFCTRIQGYIWRTPDSRFTGRNTTFLFNPVDTNGIPYHP